MYIRKDDVVEVVTGDDKGTRGKVLKVLRGRDQVVVEGVNRVYRHLKPSRRNPQGGRLSKEMPVDAMLSICSRGTTSDAPSARLSTRAVEDSPAMIPVRTRPSSVATL